LTCRKCKKEIPEDGLFCPYCGIRQVIERQKRKRGNGQGTAIKRGKTWTAVWTESLVITDPDSKKIKQVRRWKGGFSSETKALAYAANPPVREEKKAVKTIRMYYKGWLESGYVKLGQSKKDSFDIAWKKIEKELADLPIGEVTLDQLQTIVNAKAKTHYPAKDIRTLLSHIFKRAVVDGEARTNLASYIEIPALDEKEAVPFNEDEVKKMWNAYTLQPDPILADILIMIYSGMMPGELLKMKPDMIQWDTNTIVGCALKTKKRKQTPTVFPDFLIPVLEYACNTSGEKKIVNMGKWQFYDAYHKTLERIGVRDLPPYSCRHTTGTALAMGNVSPFVIKEVMRHSKITTTQRYIHPNTRDSVAAVNTLKK